MAQGSDERAGRDSFPLKTQTDTDSNNLAGAWVGPPYPRGIEESASFVGNCDYLSALSSARLRRYCSIRAPSSPGYFSAADCSSTARSRAGKPVKFKVRLIGVAGAPGFGAVDVDGSDRCPAGEVSGGADAARPACSSGRSTEARASRACALPAFSCAADTRPAVACAVASAASCAASCIAR